MLIILIFKLISGRTISILKLYTYCYIINLLYVFFYSKKTKDIHSYGNNLELYI